MKIMVWMFFQEYAFHLRTTSTCLLLKYINSVLVLHLKLEKQKKYIKYYYESQTQSLKSNELNVYSKCKHLFFLYWSQVSNPQCLKYHCFLHQALYINRNQCVFFSVPSNVVPDSNQR